MNKQQATALTRRIVFGAMLIGVLLLAYRVLHLFLVPLAWSIILAYLSWPLFRRLRAVLGDHATAAALLMTLLLSALFVLPLIWLITLLRAEIPAAYQATVEYFNQHPLPLPDNLRRLPWVGPELEKFLAGLPDDRAELRAQLLQWARPWVDSLGSVLGDVGRNLIKFGFALLAVFFVYRDGEHLLHQTRQVARRFLDQRGGAYLSAMADTTRAVLYGLVLTALAQGALAGIGYWGAGVGAPVLLGAITAVAALIPFGTPLVWGSVGLWLIVDGHTFAGIGLLAWGALVVSWVDNLVRPLVISSATRMPFLLVIFAVLGGISGFGLIGLFLGPIIIAVLLAIWREWLDEQTQRGGADPH